MQCQGGSVITRGCTKRICRKGKWKTEINKAICCYDQKAYEPNQIISKSTAEDGCTVITIECKMEWSMATVVNISSSCSTCSTCEKPVLMTTGEMPVLMTTGEMPVLMTTVEMPVVMTTGEMPVVMTTVEMPIITILLGLGVQLWKALAQFLGNILHASNTFLELLF